MLDSFNIRYREDQKLFKNLAVFYFESSCVKEETYKETETTKWIGKHVPISVSVSSNLIPEPICLCSSDPRHLVSSFISALESLAAQSTAQMKLNFIEEETAIKILLSTVLEQLIPRQSQTKRGIDSDDDDDDDDDDDNDDAAGKTSVLTSMYNPCAPALTAVEHMQIGPCVKNDMHEVKEDAK